ncbi:MAG TPA: hypothetical protein VMZ71_03555, partial [Gemmataceae bacterium]|nr:hypothetical protein [Gemmataceae bacterium]
MLQSELPKDEWTYYLAGLVPGNKCEAVCDKKFYLLSHNAKFQSFPWFFNAEVTGTDTMNPAQREFVRLAQIFKARMITEIQLKQRVVERTLLEGRIGRSYREKLQQAWTLEDQANHALKEARDAAETVQLEVVTQFQGLFTALAAVDRQFEAFDIGGLLGAFETNSHEFGLLPDKGWNQFQTPKLGSFGDKPISYIATRMGGDIQITVTDDQAKLILASRAKAISELLANFKFFDNLEADEKLVATFLQNADPAGRATFTLAQLRVFTKSMQELRRGAATAITTARRSVDQLAELLQTGDEKSAKLAVERYNALRADLLGRVQNGRSVGAREGLDAFAAIDSRMGDMLKANFRRNTAAKRAQEARRPLDEKRLLDMLVDDMEEKFIELMEGTRAHTANVDNYM